MSVFVSATLIALLPRLLAATDDVSQPPGIRAATPPAAECRDQTPTDWRGRIGSPQEPGARMLLSGRVLAADGTSPVVGATLYAYHTDTHGYYSSNKGMDNQHPRLCIVLRTDAGGRYRIETMRPAAYASGDGPPPHVHFEVWGDAIPRRSFHLSFDEQRTPGGDAEAARGTRSAETRPLVRDADGVWHCVRDLRMR